MSATTITQEQLMKQKIKYLEDRIHVLEMCVGRINNILGRFQMTENKNSGFKDIDINESVGGGFSLDDDHELI